MTTGNHYQGPCACSTTLDVPGCGLTSGEAAMGAVDSESLHKPGIANAYWARLSMRDSS